MYFKANTVQVNFVTWKSFVPLKSYKSVFVVSNSAKIVTYVAKPLQLHYLCSYK